MKNIIDEIIEDLLKNGRYTKNVQNVSVIKNADGDVTITYKNPASNEDVKSIKSYIDALDDDIFTEAVAEFKKNHADSYNILKEELDYPENIEALKAAFSEFKFLIQDIVTSKVAELSEKIEYYTEKYLKD